MKITALKKQGNQPMYKQVVNWFEDQLRCGGVQPGDKLPSTDELAKKMGVGRKIIQQSFEELSARGYLDRAPGMGTFISPHVKSNTICVVMNEEYLTQRNFGYMRLVCAAMNKIAQNYEAEVTYTIVNNNDIEKTKRDIEALADSGRIRAVLKWDSKLELKKSIPTYSFSLNTETVLQDSIPYRALSYLIARSCKKILVIENSKTTNLAQRCKESILEDYSADLKIDLEAANNAIGQELDLREKLQTWLKREKYDAIISLDDNLTRNIILFLYEMGIKIPDDIYLLSHANKNSPIVCPVELTLLENDPDYLAAETIKNIVASWRGEDYQVQKYKAKLIIGKSCGE
ncbi:Histidine utilization repressor [Lentisphaera araneosa HTCC2155]|uniref:Histidine utilization repressor n=1 Tax=Lentisphaera araneosa HTCC2155 TaxID=313628 RepID=A6DQY2_9BACT|nr:GntR family transcriptional regulator [Lentisphaera araneosa]EDM26032.1 Histidine utilization repressor [Lentisphaera araneosa HTCC2155]